ncbi:NAD-dependent epimerase/dehydratase family protein [Methanoplanus limicola]|uniref:NAD-dependent epimerase/dehydratase n=1 Tax=Methanoplanus limicola DSM 2279 TaxID=937775 RepID=H1Z052_9EURY|nr:NAD(P)-dependent oxidoreductase [Methanoplanus limicola]EHQ36144.1 NAD-dependent epimerase/dehydratase [Methanoplanus limicola DSM 2279]
MRNILITGGNGFIGTSLSEKLINRNIRIVSFDINPPKNQELKNLNNFTYIKGDINNKSDLKKLFSEHEFTGIIHLASVSRVIDGEKDPDLCRKTIVHGTKNLTDEIASSSNQPFIIYGSSREVYGESQSLPVLESSGYNPVNVYGESKAEAEKIIRTASEKLKLKSVILRFSNVYGNRYDINDRVIPRFILGALNNNILEIHGGRQIFDFTNIDDTVAGIECTIHHLLKEDIPKGYCEDFHITTGNSCSLYDVVNIIRKITGKNTQYKLTPERSYDVNRFVGNPQKAIDILGYNPETDLETGIKKTIDSYRGELN